MEVARVALVVPHELPAELDRILDDLGIIVAHLAVEGGGAAHAMTCHHLHQAKDADAVAVVARRPIDDIGCLASPAGHRLVQREGLDVRNDPECNARAVRPGDRGSTVDWNIVKWPRALRLHRHLLPMRIIGCMLEVGELPPRPGRHHFRHLWAPTPGYHNGARLSRSLARCYSGRRQ